MRRNLSTRRLSDKRSFFVTSPENPVLQLPVLPLSPPAFVHVHMSIFIYISRRTYTRQTSLGITHVTLCYLVPSTHAVPQLFSNNHPRSVLIPPGLSCSPLSGRTYISHAVQRSKLLLSFRGITLVAAFPYPLQPLVEKSTTRHEKVSPPLLAPLDCFRRTCISRDARTHPNANSKM